MTKIGRRLFIGLIGFVLVSPAATAWAKTRSLNGTVTYRERIALPPSAIVEVRLLDVSRADAGALVIAKTSFHPAGQAPIRYKLLFGSTKIERGHRYALRARIAVGEELWFTSTQAYPVLTGGKDKTNITVQRTSKSQVRVDALKSPSGRWLAEDIDGGGVIDRLQTVLEIADDGRISGNGGCNRMTGKATVSGDKITFGPIASTNMACTPAAMNQESKFFATLRDVRAWHVDPMRREARIARCARKAARGAEPDVIPSPRPHAVTAIGVPADAHS